MIKIGKLTTKCQNYLTLKVFNYLTNFYIETSNFYGLSKVHKSKVIQNNIKRQNFIISRSTKTDRFKTTPNCSWCSLKQTKTKQPIRHHSETLFRKVPSYIRDDMEFLIYIPQKKYTKTQS